MCEAILREACGGPNAASLCSSELLGLLLQLAVRLLRNIAKASQVRPSAASAHV